MPYFSKTSMGRLNDCHKDLITIFKHVIKFIDCSVLVSYRPEHDQNLAFETGKSKLRYPDSKHNKLPAMAVDVAPYPIDWEDAKRFYYFGGIVLGIANRLYNEGEISHRVRWGGDWNMNHDLSDQDLFDLVHFELVG